MAQDKSPGQKKTHHKTDEKPDEAAEATVGDQLEGEGSYTGTRNYDKHVAEHIQNEDVSELAEEARKALEGPEGEALREAEKQAKKGPSKQKKSAPAPEARANASPPPSQK